MGGVIAVVDDDASIVRALTRLLTAAGFSAKGFGSADDLLAWDGLRTIDCLILDVHLGRQTGFDVQDRLEAMHVSIPIVFITAHDDPATRERARRSPTSQYLRKPFDDGALIEAIRTALTRTARATIP